MKGISGYFKRFKDYLYDKKILPLILDAKDCGCSTLSCDGFAEMMRQQSKLTYDDLPHEFAEKVHRLGGTCLSAPKSVLEEMFKD